MSNKIENKEREFRCTIKKELIMNLRPLKAIRAKCLDCAGGQMKEIRFCTVENCSLYSYRFGSNPNRKGIGRKTGCFSKKMVAERSILKQTNLANHKVGEITQRGYKPTAI